MSIITSSALVFSVFVVAAAVLSGRGSSVLPPAMAAATTHSLFFVSTIKCFSVGTCAAASSAIGRIAQNFPRRKVPSAVKSALPSASFRRDTMADTPNPEKSGKKIPPILMIASIAITISGTIGMKTPMASSLPRPSECNAPAILFTSARSSA